MLSAIKAVKIANNFKELSSKASAGYCFHEMAIQSKSAQAVGNRQTELAQQQQSAPQLRQQHQQDRESVGYSGDDMGLPQHPEGRENVDPVMPGIFGAGQAREQHQFGVERVVNIRGDIHEADGGPPQAERGGKRVALTEQKNREADERHDDLHQRATHDLHEIPQRHEKDMPSLMENEEWRMNE